MIARRYRIVGLLGKGGMGEVYRADDLKLSQSVALKFLPPKLADDQDRLDRLHNEVRLARGVSHPNVCRVYDIGEVDGEHFISMEYVDGEDLASLLRRIGRLPADKGVAIAQQLCAGLAAAHDRGVLHRDLKPANIMIDGRGQARITDFGLARLADDLNPRDSASGTPAYMAPEQLAGQRVTVQSDLYALGLVLYELFTGKRPFPAGTGADRAPMQSDSAPPTPSSLVSDIDPAVERVILRCLEPEPPERPASALAVAAALPGGDPLTAALVARETPSPEMVAAAGGESGLNSGVAAACFAGIVIGLVIITATSDNATIVGRGELEMKPAVLEQRARDIAEKLGYSDPDDARDSACGFDFNREYVRYAEQHQDFNNKGPPAINFWYRESPDRLTPTRFRQPGQFDWARGVTSDDPPASTPGMINILLDGQGRLVEFVAVPLPEKEAKEGAVDWDPPFASAGLRLNEFTQTDASMTPPVFLETQLAWKTKGAHETSSDNDILVEGGTSSGRVAYFHIRRPWERPAFGPSDDEQSRVTAQMITWIIVVVGALLLAIRNAKNRRVDWRGARRLGAFVFALFVLRWLAEADHSATVIHETDLLILALAVSTLSAFECVFYYIAIEPYVRRLWPESLISWSRLLAGRFRDPLVGRHVLVGCLFGVVWLLFDRFAQLTSETASPLDLDIQLSTLVGASQMVGHFFWAIPYALLVALFLLVMLLLFRVLLRRSWLANGVFTLVCVLVIVSQVGTQPAAGLLAVFAAISFVVLLTRFGLLALAVAAFVRFFVVRLPMTSDLSTWYAANTMFVWAVVIALASYAFFTSLAGRQLFPELGIGR